MSSQSSSRTAGMKVLVIDDDAHIRTTFARMLPLNGYLVQTACDAHHGLQEADLFLPNVILVDLRMPLGDGIEFVRQLRTRRTHAQTPVAVVTGDYYADLASEKALLALNVAIYLKPLWLVDLLDVVQRLLPA